MSESRDARTHDEWALWDRLPPAAQRDLLRAGCAPSSTTDDHRPALHALIAGPYDSTLLHLIATVYQEDTTGTLAALRVWRHGDMKEEDLVTLLGIADGATLAALLDAVGLTRE